MLDRRLLLLAFPFAAFACFSSDDNSAAPDSRSGLPDASGIDGSIADAAPPFADGAPPSDAPADVPTDTSPLPVVVTVVGPNGPEAGVTVVFDDPTGAFINAATTSAAGSASQLLQPGSSVSVLFGTAVYPQVVTVLGVEPGDALTAYDTPTASISLTVPSTPTPSPATAVSFSAVGSCGGDLGEPPTTLTYYPPCYSGSSLSLLVVAGSEVGSEVGYSYQKAIPFDTDAGTATATNLSAWSTGEGVETVTISNLPDGGATPYASFEEVVGSVGTFGTGNTDNTPPPGSSNTTFTTHPGFADFIQAEADQQQGLSGSVALQAIATRAAPPASSSTITLDASQLLPVLSTVSIDSTNVARPIVAFTSSGSLAATSGTYATIDWMGSDDAGDIAGSWIVLGPPGPLSLQMPTLPAGSEWAPPADASFNAPSVAVVEGALIPSYAALRQVGLAVVPQTFTSQMFYSGGAFIPPLPAAGTLRVTALLPSPE